MKTFKDKVAVVTGAASGIGKGMAQTFLEAGMKVVLADIDAERLKKTTKELKDAGGDVVGIRADVSKPKQVQTLSEKTLKTYGAVHVLCNNAGTSYTGRQIWELPNKAWEWVLNTNLFGVINGINTFIPLMMKQDTECHIVNTSSLAGLLSVHGNVIYGVSKHGVVVLSEALHAQLKLLESKIKISVLCPGNINTDILNSMERNRPDYVPPPPERTEEEAVFRRAYGIWLERGLDPKEVGRQVLDAIKEDRFYVITHDWNHYIEHRMNNILTRKNPDPMPPFKEIEDIVQELTAGSVAP
jgi:NAD(P)-dependent dehydrogenase (short-subunit alcohol dehydrogenase family)